jgi:hypothetical protein
MLKMVISMKKSESQVKAEAVAVLQAYLADLPFGTLEAQAPSPPNGPDWIGKLRTPTDQHLLILQAKATGQPRTAREAANQLLRWADKYPNAVPVFAAPYISPATADILTREGVGYIDLSGNCRLTFDSVYIRRQDWPNKQVQRRELRSLYSPKAERVLRILLSEPKRPWKVQALAQAASVSVGQTSNVKRLLQDREWIGRATGDGAGLGDGSGYGYGSGSGAGFGDGSGDGSGSSSGVGFVLTKPAKLLEEWAQNYRFDRNSVRDFYSLDTPAQIEAKLAALCKNAGTRYALTGFSAAARVAPMVRYQRATAYIAGKVDEIASSLALKPVSSGANISLIEPYDQGVFAGSREVNSIRIASAIQTYLDLLSFRGRGEEAAEAVLEQAIKPKW